jgi:hypothetical protein
MKSLSKTVAAAVTLVAALGVAYAQSGGTPGSAQGNSGMQNSGPSATTPGGTTGTMTPGSTDAQGTTDAAGRTTGTDAQGGAAGSTNQMGGTAGTSADQDRLDSERAARADRN